MDKTILAIIPARLKSTRFPNKLLENILGKPVLSHVIEYVKKVDYFTDIVVASNDREIREFVAEHHNDVGVIRTEPARCATERLFLVSLEVKDYDIYVSIPADEPFINPEELNRIGNDVYKNIVADGIITLYTKFVCKGDITDKKSCKVIASRTGYMLYSSRNIVPVTKGGNIISNIQSYKKHVGVFYFSDKFLRTYGEELWSKEGSLLADVEGLEQNRFVDFGIHPKLIEINHNYFGIDSPQQLIKLGNRYRNLK